MLANCVMTTVASHDENVRPGRSRLWLGLLFFLLCYGYLWLLVQCRLIYDGFGTIVLDVPVFAVGWPFLRGSLAVPGGLVVYTYGFLSQGFYYSWLGALVVVLVVLGLYGLARQHCVHAGRPHPAILPYLPPVMVLLMYSRYDHALAACLTLAVGLLFSLVFEKAPVRRRPIRIAVFGLVAGVGYWLGGAGAALVFALLTTVYRLVRRDWIAGLLTLPVTALIIWVLADYVFLLSPAQAFVALTPWSREWTEGVSLLSRVLAALLYLFVPATVSLIHLWPTASARKGHVKKVKSGKTRAVRQSHEAFMAQCKKSALPAVPVAVLVLGLALLDDKTQRQIVEMNALSRRGQWSQVLELGRRMPKHVNNIYCNHDIDRALYHTGRMGYDLFCFPQNPHALLLTHEQDESYATQVKMCDALIELGDVDLAEKLANEFLAAKGNLGIILEKLAWINIIKGQDDGARVYLDAMQKDLIWRDRANSMLRGLDNGFGPDEAAYIRRVNSCIRPQGVNGKLNTESVEAMLTGLLEQNPRNRMAFEYLMAGYLLAGQVDKIEANMERLADLGYSEVPTLYEEAILIGYGARRERLDLNTLPVKRQTFERYKRFVQLSDSMRAHNRQTVFDNLLQEFGASYFFYYRFTIAEPATSP
jgi:hypothetical protein